MNGTKLDARTYAILVLAFLVGTLSVHLVAQQGTAPTTAFSSADTSAATRAVADSTRAVAESNAQIAAAIRDLASAVRDVRIPLERMAGMTTATPGAAAPVGGAPAATEPGEEQDKGVFELN